jgi:hypothetical protein
MPPGRPTLVVVSLGLDHNRRYGVGNGAGCFVSIRQLPFALGNKFDRICASRTPSPISPGHSRPKLIWPGLVEASWLQLCVVVNLAPKIVSVSIRTGRDRTGRIGAVNFVPRLPHADGFVRKWSGDQGSTSIVIIARQTIARGQHSLLLRVPNSVCGRRQSRARSPASTEFEACRRRTLCARTLNLGAARQSKSLESVPKQRCGSHDHGHGSQSARRHGTVDLPRVCTGVAAS